MLPQESGKATSSNLDVHAEEQYCEIGLYIGDNRCRGLVPHLSYKDVEIRRQTWFLPSPTRVAKLGLSTVRRRPEHLLKKSCRHEICACRYTCIILKQGCLGTIRSAPLVCIGIYRLRYMQFFVPLSSLCLRSWYIESSQVQKDNVR